MSELELSETDEQLLELAVLQAPWYMICGEFHRHYGGAGALARRVYELQASGALEVRSSSRNGSTPSAQQLEADALAHSCYEELDSTHDPRWEIVTTDAGLVAIRARLAPE